MDTMDTVLVHFAYWFSFWLLWLCFPILPSVFSSDTSSYTSAQIAIITGIIGGIVGLIIEEAHPWNSRRRLSVVNYSILWSIFWTIAFSCLLLFSDSNKNTSISTQNLLNTVLTVFFFFWSLFGGLFGTGIYFYIRSFLKS
jgi:hypothetical protein